jgi:endonuclease YncB( thermonuclease family)
VARGRRAPSADAGRGGGAAPRWLAGLPPRRPPGPLIRFLERVLNPVFYLKLVLGLGIFALLILPTLADLVNAAMKPAVSAEGPCRIVRVTDGDTLTLMCPADGVHSARLLGYDTPERYAPQCLDEFLAAERATWALRTLIQKADRITLRKEGSDRYGRALVRLELDGQDVARLMIRAGHARAYSGGPRGSWC